MGATTNFRVNIPLPQKSGLQQRQALIRAERGQAWSLGRMVSEAIESHWGIDVDGVRRPATTDRLRFVRALDDPDTRDLLETVMSTYSKNARQIACAHRDSGASKMADYYDGEAKRAEALRDLIISENR